MNETRNQYHSLQAQYQSMRAAFQQLEDQWKVENKGGNGNRGDKDSGDRWKKMCEFYRRCFYSLQSDKMISEKLVYISDSLASASASTMATTGASMTLVTASTTSTPALTSSSILQLQWIEHVLNDFRQIWEEDINRLQKENESLADRFQENNILVQEIRSRFEENIKAFYRNSRVTAGSSSSMSTSMINNQDEILRQIQALNVSSKSIQLENDRLTQALQNERHEYQQHCQLLLSDVARSLQVREGALQFLRILENSEEAKEFPGFQRNGKQYASLRKVST